MPHRGEQLNQPTTPILINLSDSKPSTPSTPLSSSYASPPPPTTDPNLGRSRGYSLMDDQDDGSLDAPSSSLTAALGAVEPAFLPLQRRGSSTIYEGQQGVNPDLSQPFEEPASFENDPLADVYLPGLSSPTLFTAVPTADGLTHLIDKYLAPNLRPRRDLTGDTQGRNLDELIESRSWRAVARFCQDAILSASPDQTAFLLEHWTLRLHALVRLNLIDHFGTELHALFGLLPPSSYLGNPSTFIDPPVLPFHPVVPFELHVMLACLPGLRGEKERSVELLGDVLRASKVMMWTAGRKADGEAAKLWRTRAERVGALLGGVLLDLKAVHSIVNMFDSYPSPTFLESLSRLHYATGDVSAFNQTTAVLLSPESRESRKTRALESIFQGEWAAAEADWRALLSENPSDVEALNNLAVVLLFSAKLQEAIDLFSSILQTNPAVAYSSETALFNWSTLLELRTEAALTAKLRLLQGAASQGGEDVRPGTLKLAA